MQEATTRPLAGGPDEIKRINLSEAGACRCCFWVLPALHCCLRPVVERPNCMLDCPGLPAALSSQMLYRLPCTVRAAVLEDGAAPAAAAPAPAAVADPVAAA